MDLERCWAVLWTELVCCEASSDDHLEGMGEWEALVLVEIASLSRVY